MALLSQEMRACTGLAEGATAQDLIIKLDEGELNVLDGLLENEDSRASALQSLADLPSYTIETIAQIGIPRQKFFKLFVENYTLPVLIGFIGAEEVVNPITELENLLFWASIDTRTPLHNDWIQKDGASVINWRSATSGKALIAFPESNDLAPLRRLIAALFSLQHADLPVSVVQSTAINNAVEVTLRGDAAYYSATQARLIFEAISESNPKWRCLSFYRILENAYLTNIKRIFNDSFDFDAKAALVVAQKSVSSEVAQLLTLTETLGMQTEFEKFNIVIEALISADNKFIEALDKSAREDKDLYGHREIWRKAVLRFYKLRCSIAHGGTSSVIYEQFADANVAALALLPSIEEVAFTSLKLKIDV
jgi:hypothetical protein